MYIYLSKILPLLVVPLGIVIVTISAALFLAWSGRRRASAGLVVLALLVLWVSSMPITAGTLYSSLIRNYPAVPLQEIPAGDCIIVLGGAVGPAVYPRVDIELNEAVDRVYKAAQLFRAGKGQVVIVAAGNQPWHAHQQPEAVAIQSLLVEWGVPQWAIALDGASRNTRENAINAREAMEQMSCEAPLLVTSAAHMQRSVAAFENVGVSVFPVSTDIRRVEGPGYTVFDFLPQADALVMTSDVMREWIGRKVYQWRGWN